MCLSRNPPVKKDPGKDAGRKARLRQDCQSGPQLEVCVPSQCGRRVAGLGVVREAELGTDGTPHSLGRAEGSHGRILFFFFAEKCMIHLHFLKDSPGCVILIAHELNIAA